MKVPFVVLPLTVALCCTSCFLEKEYVSGVEYKKIYRIDNLFLIGADPTGAVVCASCSWAPDLDSQSRQFYKDINIPLTYSGWRPRIFDADRSHENWCAIDCRVGKIEFITNDAIDSAHPAGSLLNDLLTIQYEYKYNVVTKKLDEFEYGDLMLVDYYPYDHTFFVGFKLTEGAPSLGSFTIRFHDDFGNEMSVSSEEYYKQRESIEKALN